MKQRKFKNQNAITLIALVITIVVLLILAGVALSLVVGENGITERAVKASKTQNIAGAKEKLELDIANYATEFYQAKYVDSDETATSLKGYILGKIATGENYTIDQKDATTGEIRISIADGTNATCTVGEDGQVNWTGMSTEPVVKWEQTAQGITNGTVTLKIGDYVNYDPTAGATTTSYTSPSAKSGWDNDQVFNVGTYKTNGYGWRVFGIKNGQIQLIADEMIGPDSGGYLNSTYNTTYYYLQGNTGYENGVSELNNIGALYGHGKYATGGRSINVEDINTLTGFNPETYSDYGSKYTVNGTEYTNTFYSYDIAEKLGSDSVTKSLLLGENPGDSPYGGTYYFTNNGAERIYWLGSQYVYCYPNNAYWGLRYVYNDGNVGYDYLASSNGYENNHYFGVLPVVSLQSNIQLKQGSQAGEWSFVD